MEIVVLLAFVLMAAFFFVILSRWQKGGAKHEHDANCGHDHSHCGHDHKHDQPHDHKDGGCCGGHH